MVLHDFGGPIGMPLVLERSERGAGMALMNTWCWPLGDRRDTALLSAVVRSALGYALDHWLNASPRWLLPASFADRSRLTPAVHRHYLAPFTPGRRRAARLLGCAPTGADPTCARLEARLDALRALRPLLIWGVHDAAFGARALSRWQEVLPEAGVVRLDAGHVPQEERPDEVIEALRAWLGGA